MSRTASLPLINVLRRLWLGSPPLRGIAAACAAGAVAKAVRYRAIEPEALGAICRSADAPAWCHARTGLIVFLQSVGFGHLALALAFASYWLDWPWARRAAFWAVVLGGAGLHLYDATFSGLAIVAALLRLVRGEGEPHQA